MAEHEGHELRISTSTYAHAEAPGPAQPTAFVLTNERPSLDVASTAADDVSWLAPMSIKTFGVGIGHSGDS